MNQPAEEGRWLILVFRTFAPDRCTYDSVRRLEASALPQLARAAAHDRYRPLW